MKVSGFTFVRNAIKFDYPVVEAINSILPVCDEVVVAVGNSEDNTLELIKSINSPKIKIVETVWDDSKREGGKVLAEETDKAFKHISKDSDWAFYIQGDEVVHEKYLNEIKSQMLRYKDDKKVEGLIFNYKHFFGSYDYIGDSRNWYRREVRIIRNDRSIYSYRDAQGFRKEGRPLYVKPIDAEIYHYGWVKPPVLQQAKRKSFDKLWHDDEWVEKHNTSRENFDYYNVDSLTLFKGSHPQVMLDRIKKKNWHFDFDISKKNFSFKDKILYFIEKKTGRRVGEYRNYKVI